MSQTSIGIGIGERMFFLKSQKIRFNFFYDLNVTRFWGSQQPNLTSILMSLITNFTLFWGPHNQIPLYLGVPDNCSWNLSSQPGVAQLLGTLKWSEICLSGTSKRSEIFIVGDTKMEWNLVVRDPQTEWNFNLENMEIGFSGTVLRLLFLIFFSTDRNANWTYGQHIKICDTPK